MYKIYSLILLISFSFSQNLFISEYAEGNSYNKYIEVYNPTGGSVDLAGYQIWKISNGGNWEEGAGNSLDLEGSIDSGSVYVICHGNIDDSLIASCDITSTGNAVNFNGDDAVALAYNNDVLDVVGSDGSDPGSGWEVAGIANGTKDHTLVRKEDVSEGVGNNWSLSAGTNADDSEWYVLPQNTWIYLGSHPHSIDASDDGGGTDGGQTAEDCSNGVDDDGDSYVDCNDFDCSSDPSCPQEDCSNGIDDDGDSYIDCSDFDCNSDPACSDVAGSCAEYGCVGYTPENSCQCNDLCVEYGNCCDDYEALCAGSDDGGSSTEICDDGIDNDGDSYIDCDDYNCNGTIGDIDPACDGATDGGTTGGGSSTEICDDGIDNDGDSYIDCDDYNCNGTIGDIDPACDGAADGGTTGGGSSEDCTNGIDDDGDGFIDCNDFDCGVDDGCDGEICDDGIDNDGDSYIDCNDFDCGGDDACSGGSCAEYGCVGYTPGNLCQCNDLCVEYGNCCDDYEELCAGSGDGGSSGEICDDGIDNDGDPYIDCDDFDCDDDPACSGGGCVEPGTLVDADNLFFSEYAEGSSNNKYIEIFNGDNSDVDLSLYSVSTCSNGCDDLNCWDYPSNIEFASGTILSPGEVYIVCNPSADQIILDECDQFFTYLSNGDDVQALTQNSTGGILDIIGELGDDPGNGWDVAGVSDATKDHTLVRKLSIASGNLGDWSGSAGTNADDSEWEVYEQNYWDNLAQHGCGNILFGCMDMNAYNYNSCAQIDDGTCVYPVEVSIYNVQGQADASPYENLPVIVTGVVTATSENGFYMQDLNGGLWSGIWIYSGDLENADAVLVGDEVSVEGIVLEFYNLTEIEAVAITISSSGNSLPAPLSINSGDLGEAHEGVLVQLLQSTCESLPDEYGVWTANDGSGSANIDDKLATFDVNPGQAYDITGIGDFSFEQYVVQATAVNTVLIEGYPVADAGADQTVDYGDTVVLDGSSSYDEDGNIIGYTWTQVSGTTVNLGNYESETVSFIAPNQCTVLVFALEVVDNNINTSTDYVTVTVGDLGIACIQFTTNQGEGEECYPSEFEGQTSTFTGVVTVVKSFSSYPNFFIQDPNATEWGGVYVYSGEMDALNVGDEVSFDAEIEEYYGVTELKNLENIELISTGNIVNPVQISTGDLGLYCGDGEAYEGMFVEFSNVTVESIDSQYDSYYINDGSGTAKIDDYFFNFDEGSWPSLNVGDTIEYVRGAVHYYFGEYVVYPRYLSDLAGESGSDTGGGTTDGSCAEFGCGTFDMDNPCQCDTGCSEFGNCCGDYEQVCNGEISEVSIYDIQFSDNQGSGDDCYPSAYDDQNINVSGTVTAVKSFSSNPHFFIQDTSTDDWNGIYVYTSEMDPLNVGDAVSFNAQVEEYYGVSELKNISNLVINSQENEVVSSAISSGALGLSCGAGEMYEGMFVELYNLTVESVDSNYNSYYLNDGSGQVKIDDYFFDFAGGDWPTFVVGDTVDSIRGVVHYYFGEYVIYLRDLNDLNFDSNQGCISDGDINSDGTVNVVDVVTAVNFVLGLGEPSDEQLCKGDVNGDGVLNVVDIVVIVNNILGG